MRPQSILTSLSARGVKVWANGTSLELEDFTSALTPADFDALRAHKAAIIGHLRTAPISQPGLSLSAHIIEARIDAWYCPECGSWLLADHPKCGCWCGVCRRNWFAEDFDAMRATFARRRERDRIERETNRSALKMAS